MAAKFKVGNKVMVHEGTPGARPWWLGKDATVRAVLEDSRLYEVLFEDAADFAFKALDCRLQEAASPHGCPKG
jgi:hypothetical protein